MFLKLPIDILSIVCLFIVSDGHGPLKAPPFMAAN